MKRVKMSCPKVSIICPVYNAEKYLARLINSLLKQNFSDFELVMVNDGSSDGSEKIIKEFSINDKRIKLVSQKNQGIAMAREKGMKLAKGKYLMFVDNDDYMEDGYLEEYVLNIERGDYDIVMGGYKRIDNNGKEINFQKLKKGSEWSKYIIMAPWAKIYRKDFIDNNKIKFLDYIGEDIYFNLSCYNKNPKINILDNDNYIWFYNEKSFSNTNKDRGAKSNIDVIKFFEYLKEVADFDDKYTKYFLKRYVVWYLFFLSNNSTKKELIKQYKIMNAYLRRNDIVKVINPFSRKLGGERLKNRLAVFSVIIFEKMHLIDWFLGIIARKQ